MTPHEAINRRVDALEGRVKALEHGQNLTDVVAALHALSAQLTQTETKLMAAFDDLKTSVEKYVADVQASMKTISEAVAAALAADEAGEAVDLNALKATVDAADAALTPPVV